MADQVGDNVDEINGRGADLFGSFAEATCASLVLSAASDLHIDFCALMYPIFSRFEPNRYYQGLFYMMRRLCMALFPVNFMNEKETQIEGVDADHRCTCCSVYPLAVANGHGKLHKCNVFSVIVAHPGRKLVFLETFHVDSV